MNTLDVLSEWELLAPDADVERLSMTDLRQIAGALVRGYGASQSQALGGLHPGLPVGTQVAEGKQDCSAIALPIVLADVFWMPDPIYSFLVDEAFDAWKMLPESGSKYFTDSPGAQAPWRGLWSMPKEGRRNFARRELPRLLARMRELEPLVRVGAVRLFPWEKLLAEHVEQLKESAAILTAQPDFERVTTQHRQDEYNLGVRSGAIGIAAGPGTVPGGLAPGTPLWFVDKTPVAVTGLLNLLVSAELGAKYIPGKPGDRDVYNYIRSGGIVTPGETPLAKSLPLPRLGNAIWPDLVEIRKSNEALAVLREIISDAEATEEGRASDAISERLQEASAKIRSDASLWRAVKNASSDLFLGVLGGAFASLAPTGPPAKIAALVAAMRGSTQFLNKLYRGTMDLTAARKRADLLLRIDERM